jgi:hypothetical protein
MPTASATRKVVDKFAGKTESAVIKAIPAGMPC